jgi:hypothetical protein
VLESILILSAAAKHFAARNYSESSHHKMLLSRV